VHDALFFVHGSGGSRFLLTVIDWGIEILTTLNFNLGSSQFRFAHNWNDGTME